MSKMNNTAEMNQENEKTTGKVEPMPTGDNEPKVEKKPNVFKRMFSAIGSGFRKVRENPVAAAIGTVVGAAGALGVKAFIDHRAAARSEEAIPIDDLIEIEDSGEEPIDEETTDEE